MAAVAAVADVVVLDRAQNLNGHNDVAAVADVADLPGHVCDFCHLSGDLLKLDYDGTTRCLHLKCAEPWKEAYEEQQLGIPKYLTGAYDVVA